MKDTLLTRERTQLLVHIQYVQSCVQIRFTLNKTGVQIWVPSLLHIIIVGKKIQCQDFYISQSLHLFMLIHKMIEANCCGLPTSLSTGVTSFSQSQETKGFAVIVTNQ